MGDDPNVYVVETDDSSYPLYVHDDTENEDFLNPIGTFRSLVAEIGDGAQSADNHAVLQFDDSFAPKEGHTYTLRLSYHEVSANAENSGCGGHFLFDLKIVPDYLVWTGDAGNSDWNNDRNWRRADRTDLLAAGESYKDYPANADNYPDKDGVPSDRPCFAPLKTSSVIVPAGLDRYPVLTTRYAPATEADLNPDNPQPDIDEYRVIDVFLWPKRAMGYNRSLSAVYSDVWERYKHHCEHEGMIALNRFCEGEGINVQRLYEWLRRRKISISDYQAGLSGTR